MVARGGGGILIIHCLYIKLELTCISFMTGLVLYNTIDFNLIYCLSSGRSDVAVFGSPERDGESHPSYLSCCPCSKRQYSQHPEAGRSYSALDGVPNGIRSRCSTLTQSRSKPGHQSKCKQEKTDLDRSLVDILIFSSLGFFLFP